MNHSVRRKSTNCRPPLIECSSKPCNFVFLTHTKNILADLWASTSIFHNSRSSDYRERSSRVWSASAKKIRKVIINGGMQMQASKVSIHPEKIRRLPRRQDAVKCIEEKYDSITQRDTATRKKLFRAGQCSESMQCTPSRHFLRPFLRAASSWASWFLRKAIILRRSKAKKPQKMLMVAALHNHVWKRERWTAAYEWKKRKSKS